MFTLIATLLTAEPYIELREQARTLLQAECGSCHTRGLETAKPKALAVFDLTRSEFADGMTLEQLESAQWRLASDLKENEQPRAVSKAEQALFKRFAEAALLRRKR
ncbi:MAG: hypothetical protein JNK82_26995 [Myxococcaceae bacterium]|nr:hypothetical protein [Myxococcaceae bacterium]